MIREICVELQAELRAQGCPLSVVFGPERTAPTTYARERIVIEHDEGGDSFGPARATHKNPRVRMVRNVGAKLTIYVQSVASGAALFEHRRRAEHVLDLVLVALEKVIVVRKNGWTIKGGKFVVPADMAPSEEQSGAAYEFTFSFERAVMVQKWNGDVRQEHALGAGEIRSTTRVSAQGGVDDDDDFTTVPAGAETGCGS